MTWTDAPSLEPGERIPGSKVEQIVDELKARGLYAYADRRTNSTGTTSIVGVLRLDDFPVRVGRAYRLMTSSLRLTSGVNDGVTATLRVTTDGSTPSTASTAIATGSAQTTSNAIFENVTLNVVYVPTADETLSVLLCVARTTGTAGNASIGGDATYPIQITIEDIGEAVTDTGADI